jgi:hypothetical protein
MATYKSRCHLTPPKRITVLLYFLQHSDKAAATNRVTVPLSKLIDAMGKCKVKDIALLAYGLKDGLRTKQVGDGKISCIEPKQGERNYWLYQATEGAKSFTAAVGMEFEYVCLSFVDLPSY